MVGAGSHDLTGEVEAELDTLRESTMIMLTQEQARRVEIDHIGDLSDWHVHEIDRSHHYHFRSGARLTIRYSAEGIAVGGEAEGLELYEENEEELLFAKPTT